MTTRTTKHWNPGEGCKLPANKATRKDYKGTCAPLVKAKAMPIRKKNVTRNGSLLTMSMPAASHKAHTTALPSEMPAALTPAQRGRPVQCSGH